MRRLPAAVSGDNGHAGDHVVIVECDGIAALKVQVPLNVGVADGLNRPVSMFGVTVPRIDNVNLLPFIKQPWPYGTTQGGCSLALVRKGPRSSMTFGRSWEIRSELAQIVCSHSNIWSNRWCCLGRGGMLVFLGRRDLSRSAWSWRYRSDFVDRFAVIYCFVRRVCEVFAKNVR